MAREQLLTKAFHLEGQVDTTAESIADAHANLHIYIYIFKNLQHH